MDTTKKAPLPTPAEIHAEAVRTRDALEQWFQDRGTRAGTRASAMALLLGDMVAAQARRGSDLEEGVRRLTTTIRNRALCRGDK